MRGGNARIRLGLVAVGVVATNFAANAKLEGAAQGGHAGEGRHLLIHFITIAVPKVRIK